MGKNVFANGKEISAKKDGNKSICVMPDVCLSPPSPPAGPVHILYPNKAKASEQDEKKREPSYDELLEKYEHARTKEGDVPEEGGIVTEYVKSPGKPWKASSQRIWTN